VTTEDKQNRSLRNETCGRDQKYHLELLLVGCRAQAVSVQGQGSSINKSGTVEGLAKKPTFCNAAKAFAPLSLSLSILMLVYPSVL
jgi:hypothetical protein